MKFLKVFILTAGLVLCFNAKSFASVDLSVWGGYVFNRQSSSFDGWYRNIDDDIKQLGFKAHYNLSLTPSINLGLGAFFRYSNYEHSPSSRDAGLDIALFFTTPTTSYFTPYLRAIYYLYDSYDISYQDRTDLTYQGFGIGGGIQFNITSSIKLFTELMCELPEYARMYEGSRTGSITKHRHMAINFGVTYSINSINNGEESTVK